MYEHQLVVVPLQICQRCRSYRCTNAASAKGLLYNGVTKTICEGEVNSHSEFVTNEPIMPEGPLDRYIRGLDDMQIDGGPLLLRLRLEGGPFRSQILRLHGCLCLFGHL